MHKTAGFLIFFMMITAVMRLFIDEIPAWLPGVLASVSITLLISKLLFMQQIQSLALVSIGLVCGFLAYSRGVDINIGSFFSKNATLLALFAGVSYLRLITMPQLDKEERLPIGKGAYLRTLFGTHLFASVINLSVSTLLTDRLVRNNYLSRELAVPMTRAIGSAAFWSPFFAAMGVAITYAPGASLSALIMQGLPLALAGLIFTMVAEFRKDESAVDNFVGYPIHFSALWLPTVLFVGVIFFHELKPDWSIVLLVAGLSFLLTVIVSLIRSPTNVSRQLYKHTVNELPKMSGELTLFFSAGVFSAGLGQLLVSYNGLLPEVDMSYFTAFSAFISMVLLSIMGIHPLVSIAAFGAWFSSAQFDPNVLGFIFLSAWGIGVVAAPLSGLNLSLQGRFSLAPAIFLKWHYKYVLLMIVLVMLELWFLMKF